MSINSTISSNSNNSDECCNEFQELLHRLKKNPVEPLQFLSHVLDEINNDAIQKTDIDFQLASLIKRVKTNISILEKTNQRVKDINFIAEKNKILASRKLNYNKETLSQIKEDKLKTELSIEHPEIDAVQNVMNDTLEILKGIKKISVDDMDSKTCYELHE